MLALAISVQSSHLGLFAGLIGFGFLIGTLGHMYHSRTMILTGIMVIAMVSVYYVFVLQPT